MDSRPKVCKMTAPTLQIPTHVQLSNDISRKRFLKVRAWKILLIIFNTYDVIIATWLLSVRAHVHIMLLHDTYDTLDLIMCSQRQVITDYLLLLVMSQNDVVHNYGWYNIIIITWYILVCKLIWKVAFSCQNPQKNFSLSANQVTLWLKYWRKKCWRVSMATTTFDSLYFYIVTFFYKHIRQLLSSCYVLFSPLQWDHHQVSREYILIFYVLTTYCP